MFDLLQHYLRQFFLLYLLYFSILQTLLGYFSRSQYLSSWNDIPWEYDQLCIVFFVFQVNQVPCLLQVQPKTSNNMIFTLYRFESMFLYNSQTCPIVLPYLIRQACLKACNIAETSFVLFVDLSMVVFTVVWLVFHWHTTHIFISAFMSHYVSRVSHSAVISMQDLLLYILT